MRGTVEGPGNRGPHGQTIVRGVIFSPGDKRLARKGRISLPQAGAVAKGEANHKFSMALVRALS